MGALLLVSRRAQYAQAATLERTFTSFARVSRVTSPAADAYSRGDHMPDGAARSAPLKT